MKERLVGNLVIQKIALLQRKGKKTEGGIKPLP